MRILELILEAEELMDLDNFDDVEIKLNHASILDSNNKELKRAYIDLYIETDRIEKAINVIDDLLLEDNELDDLIYLKSLQLNDEGKYLEAKELIDGVILRISDFYLAYAVRGIVNYNLGHKTDAFKDLDFAVKHDSKNPLSYLQRGVCYLQEESNKQALDDFKTALKFDSSLEEAKKYKAIAHRLLGDEKKALKELNRLDLSNENDAEDLVQTAIIYSKNKCFEKSISLLNKALLIDETCIGAYYTKFSVYCKMHEYELALEELNKTKLWDASDYRNFILNGYAYVYLKLKEVKKSIEMANSALKEFPDFYWLNLTLSEVYGTIGENENFYSNLKIAVEGGIKLDDIDIDVRLKYSKDKTYNKLIKPLKKKRMLFW